ncbi:MAG: hypothetical protein DMG07_26195 [Acidobacteria bacterium]|nr:MAG: hypothetical protein DMG07_26195 [Acidobacteriota bacterium]
MESVVKVQGAALRAPRGQMLGGGPQAMSMCIVEASGGAGLGLALVKWVVEAHEGRVHVTSAPGHGSSFELLFPMT